jgi:hypothetical protein
MDGWTVSSPGRQPRPNQLVLDGLVDLDVVASQWPSVRESHWSLYTFLTVALIQRVALQDGWLVGWHCLGGDGHVPHQLVLDGLVDLDVLAWQWPSVRESH